MMMLTCIWSTLSILCQEASTARGRLFIIQLMPCIPDVPAHKDLHKLTLFIVEVYFPFLDRLLCDGSRASVNGRRLIGRQLIGRGVRSSVRHSLVSISKLQNYSKPFPQNNNNNESKRKHVYISTTEQPN